MMDRNEQRSEGMVSVDDARGANPGAEPDRGVPRPTPEMEAPYDGNDEIVLAALEWGRKVYRVTIDPRQDLRDKNMTCEQFLDFALSVGRILAMPPVAAELGDRLDAAEPFSFILSSVLPPDLLAQAMGLPGEQCELLANPKPQDDPTHGAANLAELRARHPADLDVEGGLRLGEILIRLGADALGIAAALRKQVYGDQRLLGEILIADGYVSAEFRDEAVRLQDSVDG